MAIVMAIIANNNVIIIWLINENNEIIMACITYERKPLANGQ
jgi:hypothetical protein